MCALFMITQEGCVPCPAFLASAASGALKNTPDSEVKVSGGGIEITIQASTRAKEDSTGSRAFRFGKAKAATSARTFK